MTHSVPVGTSVQVSLAVDVIKFHLGPALLAVHLYGSAVYGGLKPCSDIDLLVTVAERPDEAIRRALMLSLLQHSAPPGQSKILRALEVTVVARDDIIPWRYPAQRQLQFGEWLRADILAGTFEPPCVDPDLTILLMKARQHSTALVGPSADKLFDPIPKSDFLRVLAETIKLWNSPQDWEGDEQIVVLTLVRIWYSAATREIAPKDVAAQWALKRLPMAHKEVLLEACEAYLGHRQDHLAFRAVELAGFVDFVKNEVIELLRFSNDA